MLIENKAKKKVIEFVDEITEINFERNDEKLSLFIKEAVELIENNEYGIGLEHLLENLFEHTIILNRDSILKAKKAILVMNWNWEEWKVIEELVEKKLRLQSAHHLNPLKAAISSTQSIIPYYYYFSIALYKNDIWICQDSNR